MADVAQFLTPADRMGKISALVATSAFRDFAQSDALALSAQVQTAAKVDGLYSRALSVTADPGAASLGLGLVEDTGASQVDGVTSSLPLVLQVAGVENGAKVDYRVERREVRKEQEQSKKGTEQQEI